MRRGAAVLCGAAGVAALAAGGTANAQMTEEKLRQEAFNERLRALEDKMSSPDLFRVYWKDGLRLTSPDGNFDLKIGGRIHYETQWNDADQELESTQRWDGDTGDTGDTASLGPLEDAWELRRARLYLSGLLYGRFEFKWQYDFAKGSVGHRDVYGGIVNVGDWIPNVRVGHQYEPFGLDALTSSNDSTFVERASLSLAIAPNRNPGFLFWKNLKDETGVERFTWAAGVFREDSSDNSVATGDGAYNVTARITGTPWWQNEGRRFLHLGAAATRRAIAGRGTEPLIYASKPEVDTFGNFVHTGAMREAEVDWRYGSELALVVNRWSLQGEYMLTRTDMNSTSTIDDSSFDGFYVQAAYTITGEPRRWKPAEAIFQNPKPYANAFADGGIGAWEIAARFSELDLNDGSIGSGGVEGGELRIFTLGLNWYLNPNVRVMWDLSRIGLTDVDPSLGEGGDAVVGQMRVQFAI